MSKAGLTIATGAGEHRRSFDRLPPSRPDRELGPQWPIPIKSFPDDGMRRNSMQKEMPSTVPAPALRDSAVLSEAFAQLLRLSI